MAILRLLEAMANYYGLSVRDEEGAVATEYIVLLVFIALAIIVGATLLGTTINQAFDDACSDIPTSTSC